ncbi:MAG: ketoacyl-ACP synthase III [Chloroflexi bacterium]|nr:ketoacyl-ACP synthase III [Chloroflexota bacterium]
MAAYAHIAGWGRYLPSKVLSNQDLSNILDTSDEWIRSRTGIGERRIAGPRDTTATMATRAAFAALECASVPPRAVDLVIVATVTPDYLLPATASLVQDAIGAPRAGAFDLNAGCSGFVYALALGASYIQSGAGETVLVIGADTLTRFIDYSDRNTCILFGDGAGAVVLRPADQPSGVLSFVLGSDGSGEKLLWIPAGGSRTPPSAETVAAREHYLRMSGNEIYRFAVDTMSKAGKEAIRRAGLAVDDIDLVIPHQGNARIVQATAKAARIPLDRVFSDIEHVGNTSAASVPIAICDAAAAGLLTPGKRVLFLAIGSGLTWAAMVFEWGVAARPTTSLMQRVLYRAWESFPAARSLSHRVARRVLAWTAPPNGRDARG